MKFVFRLLLTCCAAFCALTRASAQDAPEEDVFRLVQAEEAQQISQYGMTYRMVKGNAKFFHNDTYLLCDSASWNVDANRIEAFGNVKIIQEGTQLQSEEMVYLIERNLAKFRGGVVELFDRDGNTLRTSELEYDTKDSVGVFHRGGAVRDSSGNIIESLDGTYDSKISTFTFERNVELSMDSIELKTTSLRYLTNYSKAFFGRGTVMWRGNGFLRSDSGSYDRNNSMSKFADKVYMNDPQYEAWSDELWYDQISGRVDMYRNSQILDTTHRSSYLAHRMVFEPSPSTGDSSELWTDRIVMTREPVVVYCGENESHQPDTLYMTGDSIKVFTMKHCDISPEEFEEGAGRVADMEYDALAKMRQDQAKSRAEENAKKMREAGKAPPAQLLKETKDSPSEAAPGSDTVSTAAPDFAPELAEPDTTSFPSTPENLADSIPADFADSIPADSTDVPPRDTTPIRYIYAYHNAKAYRSDVQVACDSMVFSEIDSVARLYGRPVLWNEIKNQLTAETMHLLLRNGNLHRGSMVTDAWVVSQVDSSHFHQIKSAEMLGYFYDNELYRYDGMGGVNAIFYLVEDAKVTTVNVKEAKMMTSLIKNGDAKRILYMESIKSDAYPIGDLVPEKQRLKGFEWRGDERPADKKSITSRTINASDRDKYKSQVRPRFVEYHKYFDEPEPEVSAPAEAPHSGRPPTSMSGAIL